MVATGDYLLSLNEAIEEPTVSVPKKTSRITKAVYAVGGLLSLAVVGFAAFGGASSSSSVTADASALRVKNAGVSVTGKDGNNYKLFMSSGIFTAPTDGVMNYLVVGGGGGGGDRHGGGGGAGGVVGGSWSVSKATEYTIMVGAGGMHGATTESNNIEEGNPAGAGSKGGYSSIHTVAAARGGGGGGTYDGNPTDIEVGSGGGGGGQNLPGTAGTDGQGHAGGQGNWPGGGGGGGAAAPGSDADTSTGGQGTRNYSNQLLAVGYGTDFAAFPQSPIDNGFAFIGGGGGGACNAYGCAGNAGGLGGGGTGDWVDSVITEGTANTGGGGGASRSDPTDSVGRNGGSGLVLIWYTA